MELYTDVLTSVGHNNKEHDIDYHIYQAAQYFKDYRDYPKALEAFKKIHDKYPDDDIAKYNLGIALTKTLHYQAANDLLLTIPDTFIDIADVYCNLGYCYRMLQKTLESRNCFRKAILKRPTYGLFYGNYASMHLNHHMYKSAKMLCKKALELDPESKTARNNMNMCHLEVGEYAQGFENYDDRYVIDNKIDRNYQNEGQTPRWTGQENCTVVIYGEQGVGDELMFGSLLNKLLKENINVILDIHPRLQELFQRTYPHWHIYGTRKTANIPWPYRYNIDYQMPMMSLVTKYIKSNKDFWQKPYIKVDPIIREFYKDQSDKDRLTIGFSWKGGTYQTCDGSRSISLIYWKQLIENHPEIDWVCLQYHTPEYTCHDDLKRVGLLNKVRVHDLALTNFDHHAALIDSLDYLISAPQTAVHLAGAVGTKTLQLTPYCHMWQMGAYGKNMPWYNCVENIWQQKPNNWQSIFDELERRLNDPEKKLIINSQPGCNLK